jgi:tight adherence protein C
VEAGAGARVIAAGLAFVSAASAVAGIGTLLGEGRFRGNVSLPIWGIAAVIPARLRPPVDLAARIEAAGSPGGIRPAELMGLKVLAAIAGALPGTLFGQLAPGRLGILCAIAAPAAGFLAPDWWLRRLTRERIQTTRRDLPALLDLVRVAVGAGLAPAQAMAAVAERSRAPLARDFGAVAHQTALGIPLAEALESLTLRLPAPELRAFTSALTRATRHGAPLSDTLAAQARDARLARRRRIEEEAAKASPKIQLVVALLLVPSVLLMVAAALAAALLNAY